MGKSSNPVDVHRREKRKREIRKNKAVRQKQRDEKVAQTRSIAEVTEEISVLEKKRKAKEGYLDAVETRKLERLGKELKIVQAHDEEQKREAAELAERQRLLQGNGARATDRKPVLSKEGVDELNKSRYLAGGKIDARMSVYYDPTMNPYGAPPPGKPRMYHTYGGGTTMDARRAIVPEKWSRDETKVAADDDGEDGKKKKKRKRKWDDEGNMKVGAGDADGGGEETSSTGGVGGDAAATALPDGSGQEGHAPPSMATSAFPQQLTTVPPPPPPPIPPPPEHVQQPPFFPPPPPQPRPPSGPMPHLRHHDGGPPPLPPGGGPPPPPPPRPNFAPGPGGYGGIPPPPPPPSFGGRGADGVPPPPPPPRPAAPQPTGPPHGMARQPPLPPPPLPPPPPPKAPPKPTKDLPPALPPPSQSVLRTSKKKNKKIGRGGGLDVDIWATGEEIEYDTARGYLQSEDGDGSKVAVSSGVSHPSQRHHQQPRQGQQQQQRFKKKVSEKHQVFDKYDPCCPSGDGYAEFRGDVVGAPGDEIDGGDGNIHRKKTRGKKKEKNGPPSHQLVDRWYYRDNATGALQGPFDSSTMIQWNTAGFFPPQTPMRNGEDGTFHPLSQTDLSAPLIPQPGTVEEKLTAPDEDGIAARIAALRSSEEAPAQESNPDPASMGGGDKEANSPEDLAPTGDDGVAARIAELRGLPKVEMPVGEVLGTDTSPAAEQVAGDTREVDSSNPFVAVGPPPGGKMEDERVEEGSAVDGSPTADDAAVAHVPHPDGDDAGHLVTAPDYEGAAPPEEGEDDAYPTDLVYPVHDHDGEYANDGDDGDVAPYPEVDGESADDVAYPEDLAYPVDEGDYGGYDAYGGGDDAGSTYPVTGAYGEDPSMPTSYPVDLLPPDSTDGSSSNGLLSQQKPGQKKVYQGDKAVVGLVPSNLQKRRPAPGKTRKKPNTVSTSKVVKAGGDIEKGTVSTSTRSQPPKKENGASLEQPNNSVADDYDKFMDEINQLQDA